MKLTLYSKLEFLATHSLEEREEAHPHRWKMVVGVSGPQDKGRVVSLPLLRDLLIEPIAPLSDTYLNENAALDEDTRRFPTCENLAFYFFPLAQKLLQEKISPELFVESVEVSVQEPDGVEHGYCVLKRE